jgi:transcriptional regulator with XRE-family HTH domain
MLLMEQYAMDWPNFNSFAVTSLRFQDTDVGSSGRLRTNALDHGTETESCTGGDYMELTKLREKIGFNVREYRLGRAYSQGVLAELCGLNRSYIGSVERSEHNIGIDNLERLSLGLAVSPVELLEVSTAGLDDGTPNEQAITEISSVVVLSRKRFFELLKQCAVHRPDLVAIYLDRCGVRFVE